MPTTKMPVKSKWGPPMKLLPTSMVAAVTKAIAAIRNMAGWKSTGVFSFSAIPRQIQRVFERLPANRRPDDNGSYGYEKAAERAGAGAAPSRREPGGAGLPPRGGLRARARPVMRVPLCPVLPQTERRGGHNPGAAGPDPGLGSHSDRRHQAGDAAPRAGHQHPDGDWRGPAFRAAQFPH